MLCWLVDMVEFLDFSVFVGGVGWVVLVFLIFRFLIIYFSFVVSCYCYVRRL